MRALVIGGDGAIGRALKDKLESRQDTVFFTTRRPMPAQGNALHLDLASSDAETTRLPQADITFFCAAITGFAACRNDRKLAERVNFSAPSALARRLVDAGSRVVFLSSNAVFDWREPHVPASREPHPVTEYGHFKAKAEKEFFAMGSAASILRLSKVLRSDDRLFGGWIDDLNQKRIINAYADHCFAPISLADAIEALVAISQDSGGGMFQMSGARDISYFDAARRLVSLTNADPKLVVSIKAADSGVPANEIIRNSTLDSSRIAALTGWTPRDPLSVIDDVFHERIGRSATTNRL
jgi:dTDP-4-dehydrorhamnose reductase